MNLNEPLEGKYKFIKRLIINKKIGYERWLVQDLDSNKFKIIKVLIKFLSFFHLK